MSAAYKGLHKRSEAMENSAFMNNPDFLYSMAIPLDGSSGAPICAFYLSGRELYDICEISVSLSAMMNTAQLLLGSSSYGLLGVTPKDENGAAYSADELSSTVIRQADGIELKE